MNANPKPRKLVSISHAHFYGTTGKTPARKGDGFTEVKRSKGTEDKGGAADAAQIIRLIII